MIIWWILRLVSIISWIRISRVKVFHAMGNFVNCTKIYGFKLARKTILILRTIMTYVYSSWIRIVGEKYSKEAKICDPCPQSQTQDRPRKDTLFCIPEQRFIELCEIMFFVFNMKHKFSQMVKSLFYCLSVHKQDEVE